MLVVLHPFTFVGACTRTSEQQQQGSQDAAEFACKIQERGSSWVKWSRMSSPGSCRSYLSNYCAKCVTVDGGGEHAFAVLLIEVPLALIYVLSLWPVPGARAMEFVAAEGALKTAVNRS